MVAIGADVLPVYLIHFNKPLWCASAHASVLKSRGVRLDICVIDNGQTEGPPLSTVLSERTRILRTSENRGYTAGANMALKEWRACWPHAEFCVIGSHDLHVRPDALAKLVLSARAHPGFGIMAPVLVKPFESSGGVWTGQGGYQLPLADRRGLAERDWVSGTCLLLRAACIEQVGDFDESFGSYVEDVDLCLRARDAGWKVGVVQDAVAWGLGSGSEDAPAMTEANIVRLVAKRGNVAAWARAIVRLLTWTVRSAIGTLAVWRPRERRRASLRFFRQHFRALQGGRV